MRDVAAFGWEDFTEVRRASYPKVSVTGQKQMKPLVGRKMQGCSHMDRFAIFEKAKIGAAAKPERTARRGEYAPDWSSDIGFLGRAPGF